MAKGSIKLSSSAKNYRFSPLKCTKASKKLAREFEI